MPSTRPPGRQVVSANFANKKAAALELPDNQQTSQSGAKSLATSQVPNLARTQETTHTHTRIHRHSSNKMQARVGNVKTLSQVRSLAGRSLASQQPGESPTAAQALVPSVQREDSRARKSSLRPRVAQSSANGSKTCQPRVAERHPDRLNLFLLTFLPQHIQKHQKAEENEKRGDIVTKPQLRISEDFLTTFGEKSHINGLFLPNFFL